MAKNNNLTDFLTDLANAIRTKKGTSGTINPQNFSSEIASIQTEPTLSGTANTSDVLSGKTYYKDSTTKQTGTIQTYSGSTSITENTTLQTAGKYVANDIVVNIPAPTGNINITNTNSTNVTNYATARVVDADLVASNIKSGVNILGITGTYEGGIQEISTATAMNALLVEENVGKYYKFTGTTDSNYTNGDIYEVEVV